MSRDGGFNIITGQITKQYPLNSTSRRFSSLSEIKRAKAAGQYTQQVPKIRRLGTSSDSKAFNYSYKNFGPSLANTISHSQSTNQPQRCSLINASKLQYNPITHTEAYAPVAKWNNTKKLGPLSKQAHLGRINAPNYSQQYADKMSKNITDFHRKKSACTELCHIQKSYGVEKFFRKYK